MPKRSDIKSILIIGAGPIVIGQACEFDYSGAQACKALRDEGYKVILVNSNPATIMTDPEMADVTYIEPITWEVVERIIATEKPDAILPTMGGQTALNCALDLHRHGVLEKYGCELIGASPEAIDKAEDRQKFKDAMTKIGLGSAKSGIAHSMDEAHEVQQRIQNETGSSGFPVVIRPSFTMGGSGGGIAYNREEFEEICKRGLDLSPTRELLIEESLLGWKEFEMEVVRDRNDNCIIVCSIENLDPASLLKSGLAKPSSSYGVPFSRITARTSPPMAAISSINRARLGGVFKYSMTSGSSPLARSMAKVFREVPHAGLW